MIERTAPVISATMRAGQFPVVDAHHHLWRFTADEFGWISDDMSILRRNFLMAEMLRDLEAARISATVAVQARESLDETKWLLECARTFPRIQGVVGWAPLASDDLAEILDGFDDEDRLVGFREVVQGRPGGYLDRQEFNRGIEQLTERGLTYDILIFEHQIEEAACLVDRHPKQKFVLDHAGKPKIARAEIEPWRAKLLALSRRANVTCKLSGLVTEADWNNWTLDSLRPYLDACVEAFGPDRLMAGSDWPVCLVATRYVDWWQVLREYFQDFSEDEVARVFGGTAIEFYGLRDCPSF